LRACWFVVEYWYYWQPLVLVSGIKVGVEVIERDQTIDHPFDLLQLTRLYLRLSIALQRNTKFSRSLIPLVDALLQL